MVPPRRGTTPDRPPHEDEVARLVAAFLGGSAAFYGDPSRGNDVEKGSLVARVVSPPVSPQAEQSVFSTNEIFSPMQFSSYKSNYFHETCKCMVHSNVYIQFFFLSKTSKRLIFVNMDRSSSGLSCHCLSP